MKSTIKIDIQSHFDGGIPIIKFIQPNEAISEHSPDYDVRDKLVRDFLHSPSHSERNDIFELSEYFPHPFDAPLIHITTIRAVTTEDRLFRLRNWTRNTIKDWQIPFDDTKVDELFDAIDKAIKDYNDKRSDPQT